MTEQIETRIKYKTWEDAFRGLAPAVRQQSVRVATYTKTLFMVACQNGFGAKIPGGADRIQPNFSELAYKCGMYHQLGKALVVPEYQIQSPAFTPEETALYRKYTTEGRRLVACLQDAKNFKSDTEIATSNIPWLMIRESCSEHTERFDGTGYPNGLAGNKISPIAQIVGMARMFDILSSQIKSETPFTDACTEIAAQSGTAFDPQLCEIFEQAKTKLQSNFNKFIHYSKKVPTTIPLVKKSKTRPMGLEYTVLDGNAFEATPWFLINGEKESAVQVAPRLERTELVEDVSFYLLYEAADTLLRMQNCSLSVKYLILQMLPGFYTKNNHLKRFEEMFKNQPIDRSRLILTIPEKRVTEANKGELEVISKYLKSGITLMVDDYHPDITPLARLEELGFGCVRLSDDYSKKPEYASDIRALTDKGISVFATCSNQSYREWLKDSGVIAINGDPYSVSVDEHTLIVDALVRERGEIV